MINIYAMKLHELCYDVDVLEGSTGQGRMTVFRVPGGWIYTTYCEAKPSSVFVPYNDEFTAQKGEDATR